MLVQPSGTKAKAFGAYYTDEAIATFLTAWAVRGASSHVLDPSFGGGVFLEAAVDVIRRHGGDPTDQVHGVELDRAVHELVSGELASKHGLNRRNLLLSDFFDVDPSQLRGLDAVIGNPPFIRYQSFTGDARARALRRASEQGVELSALTSSWAPFLVHATSMLRVGGRLAMVIPMEIGHAAYARPVLDHLTRAFARITLLTFQVPLFPSLSQDTLLLLADGKDEPFESLGWQDSESIDDLETLSEPFAGRRALDHYALANGNQRLIEQFIDPRARDLYRDLVGSPGTVRLGELAQVGIGYVSGANDYFHLSPACVDEWRLPPDVVARAVYRGRAFTGSVFHDADWHAATESASAGYLFRVQPGPELDDKTRSYISYGTSIRVDRAYKCRVRQPWYSVPNVYTPEAFVTYMSGLRPQLVVNDAAVVAPNTLHTVRMRPSAPMTPHTLALAWQSSLASLSVEVEGHAMGGGLLKLEPREAQNVLLPVVNPDSSEMSSEVDFLMRTGRSEAARALVDEAVLRQTLGLSAAECHMLEEAAERLRVRRYYRGRAA